MSALGQKRTSSPLFDHLIGAREKRRGQDEAERLGGREIDEEFKFNRQLDWKIGGLYAPENFVDITGCATIGIGETCAVADHSSIVDKFAESVDRREPRAVNSVDDAFSVCEHKGIVQNDEKFSTGLRNLSQRVAQLLDGASVIRLDRNIVCASEFLCDLPFKFGTGTGGVP